ncbi:hypothetical protein V8F06_012107 [Rhypophila decipiens]
MGMKQCRDPRDKYISLGGMIGFAPSATDLETLGRGDSFDCCFSMALHALASGDYTPLLLNPVPNETSDSRAPWLRGYTQLVDNSWDLGVCHKKAHYQDIIKDGAIEPQLESVGFVEWFERTTFEEAPERVFTYVAIQILRSSGACPVKFCAAVDRIFTQTEAKGLYNEWEKDAATRKPTPSQSFSQYPALGPLLAGFSTLMHTSNTQSWHDAGKQPANARPSKGNDQAPAARQARKTIGRFSNVHHTS